MVPGGAEVTEIEGADFDGRPPKGGGVGFRGVAEWKEFGESVDVSVTKPGFGGGYKCVGLGAAIIAGESADDAESTVF